MSTATLAGRRVTRARVNLPKWGVWWADVALDEEAELSGAATLVVADLTLAGTIMSGGPGPVGRASFRIAGGAGQWGKTIPAKSYANDAGVKLATVVADAAMSCGETLDVATLPTTRLGPSYVREEAPAARALEGVAPAAWYVGEDGVTRLGARAVTTLAHPPPVLGVDRSTGAVRLAPESIAALVPGATVEGVEAVDVQHDLSPEGLRTTLWGAGVSRTSRRLTAMRRLLDQLDPARRYRAAYEYRIVTQSGERLELQPVRVSTGMPDLQRVFVRPGIPGARAGHFLGARVLVVFVDADPSRPAVLGFEDAEGGGFLPLSLAVDATTALALGATAATTTLAGGVLAAARVTDAVVAGPFGGAITGPGSARVRIG